MRILLPLCLTGFVGYLNLFGMSPFVAAIADDLGIGVGMVGAAITAAWIVSAAAGLVIGPVATHVGQRRTLIIGLVCIAISAAGTALVPGVIGLVAARFVGGIGASIAAGVTLAVAADHFDGEARRKALSIISSAIAIAVMVGLIMLTTISEFAGWPGAFAFLSLLSLATIPLTLYGIPADVRRLPGAFRAGEVFSTYRRALNGTAIVLLVVACFLHGTALTGLTTYLGAYLETDHGVATQVIGVTMSVLGAGYFVGTLIAGRGFGRIDLRTIYAVCGVASGLFWMALFNTTFHMPLSLVLTALVTLAAGIGWVCLITLIADHAGEHVTLLMVLSASILSAGSAFGSGLGGAILSFAGYQTLGIALGMFAILAAPVVLRRQASPLA